MTAFILTNKTKIIQTLEILLAAVLGIVALWT